MSATSSESETRDSQPEQLVLQAKKDLAQRLSVSIDKIKLLEARAVNWPDSSLGCPKAGMIYTQQVQPGFLIRLKVAKQMYFYHSGGAQNPFLCKESAKMIPHPGQGDEFIPPPGIKID